MFTPPPKTLLKSLHRLLDYAQDYVADVRFDYPGARIWAHRAILLARAPEQFRTKYMPELMRTMTTSDIIVFNKPVLPYAVFLHVLRFWYTAEFYSPEQDLRSSVSGSSMSELSLTSSQSSATVSTLPSEPEEDRDRANRGQLDIISEIQCHEKRLGTILLPTSNDTPAVHLIADINRMWKDKIATDVVIRLLSNPKEDLSQQLLEHKDNQSSLSAHRFMLAVQSSYFNAMFCKQFREASSSTIYLPSDLFTPTTLQVILCYFYTEEIHVPALVITNKSPRQVSLINKKHALRVLQDVFRAADYLGQYETVCLAVLQEMDKICHHFKCACPDCSMLLPAMLWFAETYKGHVPAMRLKLGALYADPLHSLANLWSTEAFAILLRSQPAMATEITTQTLANIKKHTAIQILECFHLCLSRLRSADPVPSWSVPIIGRVTQLVSHTVSMISDNFGFYCVEYPILLSCVDGIGVGSGLSVDFLDFLLKRVVDEGINDRNAGEVYQGIVRDLIGRQEVDHGRAVDHVLVEARQQCIEYLSRRWPEVKAEGGFKSVEKEVMRCLSEDINVPYRALAKSFDADIASLFGFKSRARRTKRSSTDYRFSSNTNGFNNRPGSSYRRLSMLSLRSQRSQENLRQEPPPGRRSADLVLTQPRGRSLSLDSAAELAEPSSVTNASLAEQTMSTLALADALLAMDHVPPTKNEDLPQPEQTSLRRTRLKFELPKVPERPASVPLVPSAAAGTPKAKHKRRGRSPLRYRLGLGNSGSYYSSCSDASDDDDSASAALVVPVVGAKVELLRRPLPMTGVIKYIGPVHFAKGTYVGVELESRCSSDGSYEGTRYFQTDPQRGAFCKLDDFKIISLPHRSN